ncbi:hypothetical protein [Streptomyces oceani]|uniref:DUF8017 domain-containing protein n=1 Tax=Streptomyces oceani TaxID=1075402 RepID=A0A1E7JMN2_9ACTN|nr:hypothetical protein [Streptomyces oceani]OEU89539.1 hypothetical protein AN216_25610 [Streptomyces oceani]
MWPGDQQSGENQNPQQPNPYQQPGYQQPNPYQQPPQPGQSGQPPQAGQPQQPGYGYPQQPGQPQQPGYGYPQQPAPEQSYAPPGAQQWGASTMPGAPQPQQGGGRNKTAAIAIVTAVAVVAAAVITGVFLMQGDDEETPDKAGGGNSSAAEEKPSGKPEPSPTKSKDPSDPVIPGWQSVVNPKHYTAFDVPKTDDWEVAGDSYLTGFTKGDTSEPLVTMSAPAFFKKDWCDSGDPDETSERALVGSKGAQGAKSSKEAAKIAAGNWVIAGYDQKQKGKLKVSEPKKFSNEHGVKGHVATATVTGAPKKDKCDVGSAKSVAVSWINSNDDLVIWVLLSDKGVKDEVPNSDVKKMMQSLRSSGEPEVGVDPRG